MREKEGGTLAITSLESRLLVSCSCPDFVSLSLFPSLLTCSLTVGTASVPKGGCQISQLHTLFLSV